MRTVLIILPFVTEHTVDQQIEDRLDRLGARLTTNRRLVVDALIEAPGPVAAADLVATLKEVPLSSLYRSLSVLCEAEIVATHQGADGITRFEMAEWAAGHHHHLVCVTCGSVTDFELDAEAETLLHDLAERIGSNEGFNPIGHSLEVDGICEGCADG